MHLLARGAVLVAAGGLIAGCGSSGRVGSAAPSRATSSTTAAPAPPSTGSVATPPGSGGSFSATPLSPIGSTQVTTSASGHQLGVLVSRVLDPATFTGSGASPAGSGQLVAVNLQLEADGSPSSEHPLADLRLTDREGRSWSPVDPSPSVASCTPLAATVTVTAEDAPYGCAVFVVPKGTAVARVTYTPDGSTAGHGLAWSTS